MGLSQGLSLAKVRERPFGVQSLRAAPAGSRCGSRAWGSAGAVLRGAPRACKKSLRSPPPMSGCQAADAPALASSPSISRVALPSPSPAVPCPRPDAQTWLFQPGAMRTSERPHRALQRAADLRASGPRRATAGRAGGSGTTRTPASASELRPAYLRRPGPRGRPGGRTQVEGRERPVAATAAATRPPRSPLGRLRL